MLRSLACGAEELHKCEKLMSEYEPFLESLSSLSSALLCGAVQESKAAEERSV